VPSEIEAKLAKRALLFWTVRETIAIFFQLLMLLLVLVCMFAPFAGSLASRWLLSGSAIAVYLRLRERSR
jgi:hypothetical protein